LLICDDAKKQELSALRSAIAGVESELAEYREASVERFNQWLKNPEQVHETAATEIPGLAFHADFEQTKNAANQLVAGPNGLKALKLTGDDEVRLDAGRFLRHQPFTISTRIKVPNEPQLLKRSVILHRSRAWTDSASRGYQILVEDGKLSASLIHFWPGDAISVRTKDPVATDKWIDVAMVYDGSSSAAGLLIYVDGKPASVEIVRDNLQKSIVGSGTNQLVLGARFRDVGFKNGELADLRVFDRQLSGLEIASLNQNETRSAAFAESTDQLTESERERQLEYFLRTQDPEYAKKLAALSDARRKLNEAVDRLAGIMVMREMEEPRLTYVLRRGAYDAPTDPVAADTPAVFPPLPRNQKPNRLALARWLTSGQHPLTARVAVNHYWQLLFGNGLVRTPEDFGSQGEPPTHPKLLDTLAVDFQEHGWDVQWLIKKMVMSRTYRQTTATSKELLHLDPENKSLGRAPTYRLPAEMLRDNALATSGLLVEKIGGAPVRPYELAVSFNPSTPDKGEGLYRRSLYTYWKRTGPAPVMLTLDSAKRDVCQVKRERTSSPLAALVQLNNPQTVEASRILAEKLLKKHGGDETKIVVDLFRTLTSRVPTDQETAILVSLYKQQLTMFENDETAAKQFLDVGESKSETEQPLKLAAWATVADTLFSFDECVMKR
jgi:hypothetical protein